MQDYTEIVFILDRSGSMGHLVQDTIGGFNSMLAKNQDQKGDAVISTILFDHKTEVICNRKNIKNVKPLTTKEYYVRGCTALLDAVGGAIEHTSHVQKELPKHHRAKNILFIITTDGLENASTRYTYADVKKLINKKVKKGWEFIFMGANIDAIDEASKLGIREECAATYFADSQGTESVYEAMSLATLQARNCDEITGSWKLSIEEDMASRE